MQKKSENRKFIDRLSNEIDSGQWLSEKEQKLTSGIDLNEIKQKAQELGMKPADETQIVYYEIEHKNYMNQYEDVE